MSPLLHYHFDALGSTKLITDGDGYTTDRYTYDAWGSVISHDRYVGSIDQPYQYVGQLGYYTHYQEPDFGLMQLGVRYYDAEVGRFTQRDRRGSISVSAYTYAINSPLIWVDWDGFAPKQKDGSNISEAVLKAWAQDCERSCVADQTEKAFRSADAVFAWIGKAVGAAAGGRIKFCFDTLISLYRQRAIYQCIVPACSAYCKDRLKHWKEQGKKGLPDPPYEDYVTYEEGKDEPVKHGFSRWWHECDGAKHARPPVQDPSIYL